MPDLRSNKYKNGDTKTSDPVKLFSDIHDTAGELVQTKNRLTRSYCDIHDNHATVRGFVNMQDLLTEQEREEEGKQEITNYGFSYRHALSYLSPQEAVVSGTNQLIRAKTDTDNFELDTRVSSRISEVANNVLINRSDKFQQLWRTLLGEGFITGGLPLVYDYEDSGLYPRAGIKFLFPLETKLFRDDTTFCFEKVNININDLKEMAESVDGKANTKEYFKNAEGIEALIEQIETNIKNGSDIGDYSSGGSFDVDLDEMHGVRFGDNGGADHDISVTLGVWRYYEVRYDDDENSKTFGQMFVTRVVFVDGYGLHLTSSSPRKAKSSQKFTHSLIVEQEKTAFKDISNWLDWFVVEEEIGGEKSVGTLRGLAEAYYRPAVAIEQLHNVQMESAMASARPVFENDGSGDPDEVDDFQLGLDDVLPTGLRPAQLPDTGRNLNPVIGNLVGVVSGISSGDRANTGRGQELRQQAVERQNNSTAIKGNLMARVFRQLDRLLEKIVFRAMTLDPDKGTEDYHLIKVFQKCVDDVIIDEYKLADPEVEAEEVGDFDLDKEANPAPSAMSQAKKIRLDLAKKEHGFTKYLRVSANRTSIGQDRIEEKENAEVLSNLLFNGQIAPELAPSVLRTIVTLQTGNHDITEMVAQETEPIAEDQRRVAQWEWEVIKRRATIEDYQHPVSPKDIDENHIESHMIDLVADVNSHGLNPWTLLQVKGFEKGVAHISAHIRSGVQKNRSKERFKEYATELQNLVGQTSAIIAELAEQEQNNVQDGDPDAELKRAKTAEIYQRMELQSMKFGVDMEKEREINSQRLRRAEGQERQQNLVERQQAVNERNADRKYALDLIMAESKVN